MIEEIYKHIGSTAMSATEYKTLLNIANVMNALTYCSFEQEAIIKIAVKHANGNYTEGVFNNDAQLNYDIYEALRRLISEYAHDLVPKQTRFGGNTAYDDYDTRYTAEYAADAHNKSVTVVHLKPTHDEYPTKYITIDNSMVTVADKPLSEFTGEELDDCVGKEDMFSEPLMESYDLIDGRAYWLDSKYAQYIAEAFAHISCECKS